MTLATLSNSSIEDAMAVASGPIWFQLYMLKDRDISVSLVKRAEAAGGRFSGAWRSVGKLG
jgi:4-hydroxymandelate oxidase